jgi:endoglucanase
MNFEKSVLIVGLAAASGLGCGSEPAPARPALVHVQGDRLVDPAGAPLTLEGIMFGGLPSSEEPFANGSQQAYAEVARMGFNHVRLYFNASTLEQGSAPGSYRPEGLAWLDANVARARKQGLYLVLALGVPPGGTPLDCGNDAFWDSADSRDRFVELWRMLAARYADEPVVAGYALLDPANPNHTIGQWQELADRTTAAIRAVDRQHTLNIGRALSVNCKFDLPASETFVRVDDANVIYEFDRLQPWNYVAQLTTPAQNPERAMLPEYGPYPDETRFAIDPGKVTWLYTPQDTRPSAQQLKLKPEETEWTKKTFYYTVTEPRFAYAVPVLQADDTAGKAYFDDILIEEVSDTGEARVVKDIDIESSGDWYFWEGNSSGQEVKGTGVVSMESSAHRGQGSVALRGTTGFANLSGQDWSTFLVSLGRTYRVTSWVKGEGITAGDLARVRLDFYGYSEPLHGFDRKTLEELFTDLGAWGRAQGLPMAVSPVGTARPSFDNDRGGLAWVSDMIDILREQRLSWAYLGYRDQDFGIYTNPTGEPDPETVNQPLVDLFTEKLH